MEKHLYDVSIVDLTAITRNMLQGLQNALRNALSPPCRLHEDERQLGEQQCVAPRQLRVDKMLSLAMHPCV